MSSSYTYLGYTGINRIEALQREFPEPLEEGKVVIKVAYSSLTPFDLYQKEQGFYVQQHPSAFGLNASGTIAKVGPGVTGLKEGDRVTAFTSIPPGPVNRGMQEYTYQDQSVVAKIPDSLTLEEAVTLPDNFVTSFYTLFNQLGLPWNVEDFPPNEAPPHADRPILIYGAGATSGQYAVQLLKLAKYTNVVAVASSRHNDYLRSLGAKAVVDYRSPTAVEDIARVVGGDGKVELVVDCVSLDDSVAIISKSMRPGGVYAFLAPLKHGEGTALTGVDAVMLFDLPEDITSLFPANTKFVTVRTFTYQEDATMKKELMPNLLPRLIQQGFIKPNATQIFEKGTFVERVNDAFDFLAENSSGGKKVVVKVEA